MTCLDLATAYVICWTKKSCMFWYTISLGPAIWVIPLHNKKLGFFVNTSCSNSLPMMNTSSLCQKLFSILLLIILSARFVRCYKTHNQLVEAYLENGNINVVVGSFEAAICVLAFCIPANRFMSSKHAFYCSQWRKTLVLFLPLKWFTPTIFSRTFGII